jgi:deferrochelatase/peroxidase EfeB
MPATKFQAGIAGRPPEHVLVAALTFSAPDVPSCRLALQGLRELVRRELAADIDEIDPDSSPAAPTSDTGELGVDTGYDTMDLTVTMGLSSTGFTRLGVAPGDVPLELIPINWGWFADNPVNPNQGDLVLQICSDSSYIAEHVLRRIEHTMGGSFGVAWALSGEQRNRGHHGEPLTADTARALIGFHDGLSNLNPKELTDQQLIYVGQDGAPPLPPTPPGGQQPAPQPGQPGYNQPGTTGPSFPGDLRQPPAQPEPAWARDGSYLVVRASLLDTSKWDRESLQQQQQEVGRWKYSGASLDNPNEPAHRRDEPQFVTAPTSVVVPLTSHIRRANPRSQVTDALRRIFRRGYPLMLTNANGTMERGLLFIAFARSLITQPEFIMRAWLKNPDFPTPRSGVDPILALETQVLAGGYYFVPPVSDAESPWDWQVPGI